jgi:amino acid transporter
MTDRHSYALQWLVVLPLEIVAATFTIEYWNGGKAINNNAYVAIFLVLIVVINLFGYVVYANSQGYTDCVQC